MRALLSLLGVALLLTGCATDSRQASRAPEAGTVLLPQVPVWQPPATVRTYTALEVQTWCLEINPYARVYTTDSTFTPVNHEWLLSAADWWHGFLVAIRWSYLFESGDCDKYSLGFAVAGNIAARKAGVKAQPLVGRMDVRQVHEFQGIRAGGYHSLNLILTDREPYLWVREPQAHRPPVPLREYPNRDDIIAFRIGG